MDKTFPSADAAVADMTDGITLMAGGFGLCGNPENLIAATATLCAVTSNSSDVRSTTRQASWSRARAFSIWLTV